MIRSLAETGVVAGSTANGEDRFPLRQPQRRLQRQAYSDRLLIGPGSVAAHRIAWNPALAKVLAQGKPKGGYYWQ